MARKLRIEFPGALYHVINRGNYRRDLFESVGAGEAFLVALAEGVKRYDWRLHAYVLMRNHFHLAIETPKPNLVEGMHWLQSTVATRFNRFRQERGHLFQGRFQSLVIEDFSALGRVVDYIHLNPFRAGIVTAAQVGDYRWSSLFRFLRGTHMHGMVAQEWLHSRGGWNDDSQGWASYRTYLSELAADSAEQKRQGLEGFSRGWAIGTRGWRQALAQEYAHRKLSVGMEREQIQELKHAAWESELEARLASHNKRQADLQTQPKAMAWKLAVARELRDAGAAVAWIAKHLHLGKPSSVRSYLSRAKKSEQSISSGLTPLC